MKCESVTSLSRRTGSVLAAFTFVLLTACGHPPMRPEPMGPSASGTVPEHSTLLLVGLEDGSIVRQTLALDADICIKELSRARTMCLTQGDAIVNDQGVIVGYEMLPETIELRGKN